MDISLECERSHERYATRRNYRLEESCRAFHDLLTPTPPWLPQCPWGRILGCSARPEAQTFRCRPGTERSAKALLLHGTAVAYSASMDVFGTPHRRAGRAAGVGWSLMFLTSGAALPACQRTTENDPAESEVAEPVDPGGTGGAAVAVSDSYEQRLAQVDLQGCAFEDPVLERAARVSLLKLESDVSEVTHLQSLETAKSLKGIECFTGLQSLELWNDGDALQELDLTPLAELTALSKVALIGGSYTNIEVLATRAMSELSLRDTKLVDLSFLEGASNLSALTVVDDELENFQGLAALSSLQVLVLAAPRFEDASPLQKLTSLQSLTLEAESLSDLSALANHATLERFTSVVGKLTSLAPLGTCPSLQDLSITDQQIDSLLPLETASTLTVLNVSGNPLSSLEGIENLELTKLVIDDTRVGSLELVQGLPLTELSASNNGISDLSPLEGMPLETLVLSENAIVDVSPLVALPLFLLDLSGNLIEDLPADFPPNSGYCTSLALDGNPLTTQSVDSLEQRCEEFGHFGVEFRWTDGGCGTCHIR